MRTRQTTDLNLFLSISLIGGILGRFGTRAGGRFFGRLSSRFAARAATKTSLRFTIGSAIGTGIRATGKGLASRFGLGAVAGIGGIWGLSKWMENLDLGDDGIGKDVSDFFSGISDFFGLDQMSDTIEFLLIALAGVVIFSLFLRFLPRGRS